MELFKTDEMLPQWCKWVLGDVSTPLQPWPCTQFRSKCHSRFVIKPSMHNQNNLGFPRTALSPELHGFFEKI